MGSSYYAGLIEKYKSVIQQISGLYGYLSTTQSTVKQCQASMEETQIAGESMDQGKLNDVASAITELRNAFNTIVAECQTKITEYTALYQQALAEEKSKKTTEGA